MDTDRHILPELDLPADLHPVLAAAAWKQHKRAVQADTGVIHEYPRPEVEELIAEVHRICVMLSEGKWGRIPSDELIRTASTAVNDPSIWPVLLEHCRSSLPEWFRGPHDPAWTRDPRGQLGKAHRALPELKRLKRLSDVLAKRCGKKPTASATLDPDNPQYLNGPKGPLLA